MVKLCANDRVLYPKNTSDGKLHAFISKNRKWTPYGRVLKVQLNFNSRETCQEKRDLENIVQIASSKWNEVLDGALFLVIDNTVIEPDIRVEFRMGRGHYSYVGTDSVKYARKHEHTMNLDRSDLDMSNSKPFIGTALHEFGHALGLLHEHQNPSQILVWNRDEVIKNVMKTQGWSKYDIEDQILNVENIDEVEISSDIAYDASSIMHYQYEDSWVDKDKTMENLKQAKKDGKLGNMSIDEAFNNIFEAQYELSEYDEKSVREFYPKIEEEEEENKDNEENNKPKMSFEANNHHTKGGIINIPKDGLYNIIFTCENNKETKITTVIRKKVSNQFVFRYDGEYSKDNPKTTCIYLTKDTYYVELQADVKITGKLKIESADEEVCNKKQFMPFPGGKLTIEQQKSLFNRQQKYNNGGYDYSKKEGERNPSCVAASLKRMPTEVIQQVLGPVGGINGPKKALISSVTPSTLEAVLHADNFLPSYFLYKGAAVANAVGRIVTRSSYATGFMISNRLLLTNHHVFDNASSAIGASVQFDYRYPKTPVIFDCDPDTFFESNAELDFAIVALKTESNNGISLGSRGWLRLKRSNKIGINERVNIIQHPAGRRQEISLRMNSVLARVDNSFVHYETDTEPGSSGSPVCNDNWDLVALHHSGVPKRDEDGNILKKDGAIFNNFIDERDSINWIANEGILITSIMDYLENRMDQFTKIQQELLINTLEGHSGLHLHENKHFPNLNNLPVTINIGNNLSLDLGNLKFNIPQEEHLLTDPNEIDLQFSLKTLEKEKLTEYYNEEADKRNAEQYYSDIDINNINISNLGILIKNTHNALTSYKKARLDYLYPSVDLYPDGQLYSVYGKSSINPHEAIKKEYETEIFSHNLLHELSKKEHASHSELLEAWEKIENEVINNKNCEHVVPQSWFNKKAIPKADLHHLFACEAKCNSLRANFYFGSIDNSDKKISDCGQTKNGSFEPENNKGAVARATLYFCLRYPNVYLDHPDKFNIQVLVNWSRNNEPNKWEKHRNERISKIQGNRNPFIDFYNYNIEDSFVKFMSDLKG